MHKAIIHFGLGDCGELEDPNAGMTRDVEFLLPEGPWVQMTYEDLRFQNGDETGIHFNVEDGFWRDEAGLRWSDMTIEIVDTTVIEPMPVLVDVTNAPST